MAAIARLALIADEMDEPDLAAQYRNNVRPVLEDWLAGTFSQTKKLFTSKFLIDNNYIFNYSN